MPRGNGSYIGIDANPNADVASGIWTVREAETLLRANKWPATPTVPGAPTGTAGNGQVALTWTAPTGGSTPTDYEVQYSSNGGSSWTTFSDGVSTATSATVTGLTNGTGYIFRVRAVNILGEGPYGSASGTITPSTDVSVQYLVIGGGGGGSDSGSNAGGGGGAGGYLAGTASIPINDDITVTVGEGGGEDTNGSNSVFHTLTAVGGGAGGSTGAGNSGGSGGGGGSTGDGEDKAGGAATSGQGYAGGAGRHTPGAFEQGGGGGGAGGAGGDAFVDGNFVAADGGPGLSSSITGTSVVRGGGGGGGGMAGGAGGSGGGGSAIADGGGNSGEANTGGGGGGSRSPGQGSGSGGSGVVILRVASGVSVTVSGGLTYTSSSVSSDTVYEFTAGTGTVSFA